MKVNAPEKIYLQQYDENTLICLNKWNISEEWSNKPCNEKVATNIEYIRTDAFIEKACEWLSKHFYDECYQFYDNDGMWIDADSMLEDFKNYMKGE